MHNISSYLGIDIGASSGRAVVGIYEDSLLELREINRFSHEPINAGSSMHWDFPLLWANIKESLQICAENGFNSLSGIGVDSLVDFGLILKNGKLGYPVTCYRSKTTEGVDDLIKTKIDPAGFYKITGLSASRVSALAQLIALQKGGKADLTGVDRLLQLSDLFSYYLCGEVATEPSIASISLLMDINSADWSDRILETFDLPRNMLPEITNLGTIRGHLKKELADETGLNRADVIAVAGHDTACAAAAVPYMDQETIFISSGTWSVIGQCLDKPILNEQARISGTVNEHGLECMMFVKNITGLFLFEDFSRQCANNDINCTYRELIKQAGQTAKFSVFVDTNDPLFFSGESALVKLERYLKRTGQESELSRGQIVRTLFEGLAFNYCKAIQEISRITGNSIKRICIVGGGSKNELLNQMTADATGCEVITGPEEATIAGNIGIQLLAKKEIDTPEDIRKMVRNSFRLNIYNPADTVLWEKKYLEFNKTCKTKKAKL